MIVGILGLNQSEKWMVRDNYGDSDSDSPMAPLLPKKSPALVLDSHSIMIIRLRRLLLKLFKIISIPSIYRISPLVVR
jgi:hypothetical protein